MSNHQHVLLRLLVIVAAAASATAIQPLTADLGGFLAGRQSTPHPYYVATSNALEPKPPGFLKLAYTATGLATTGAWTTVVWTSIRSNQPLGAMMPSVSHGVFARIGALSAVPLIASCFATLALKADSWDKLGSDTCRRLNLAVVASGVGSALWVNFADVITRIPGAVPAKVETVVKSLAKAPHRREELLAEVSARVRDLATEVSGKTVTLKRAQETAQHVCHQSYKGAMKAGLITAYGSAAVLAAAVWIRSLPEEVRRDPLSWPGRVADGVCKSLVSLGPANANDPTNVKYAILSTSFLVFTALQLHSFPTAVIPSWTGRRCSRAFPAWTLLAAVSSFNLKEARERGAAFFADKSYRTLTNGLAGLGAVYLAARVGAVCFDPSFPAHYGLVKQVPAWAAASAALIGLTLRPDAREEGSAPKAPESGQPQTPLAAT